MGLFEANYRASATTEIERQIRQLEEKDKAAETISLEEGMINACSSNIDFAEKIRLINQQAADDFRKRLREVKATEHERYMQKVEYRDDIVDSFENPRERTKRFESMDKVIEEIHRDKAQNASKKVEMQQSDKAKKSEKIERSYN